MAQLHLSLLGGFQVRLESGRPVSVSTKKAQALLAYLAVPAGQTHPREKLAALLWGGIRQESARNSVRQALFGVRKALAPATTSLLQIEGQNVALNADCISVDVADLEAAVSDGTPEALERAAALYRGDLLAGFVVDETPFEEWLRGERERVRELALEGLAKLVVHQCQAGPIEGAMRTALRMLVLDPLRESAHRTLMQLYARSGRRAAALRQYQVCVGALRRELGVEPDPQTKELYQDVVRGRATGSPPMHARESARFPLPETTLVGRDAELARLRRALEEAERGHGAMVLLVGEAGIGKSALIAALAADAERRGARVLLGRSYATERILPFAPWVDALRAAHVSRDDALVDALTPRWRAELSRLLPELAVPDGPVPGSDRHRLFEGVAHLLDCLAATRPLALILEDVHWADEMSLRLLSFIGRRLRTSRVLLVISAREEDLIDAPTLRLAIDELDSHLAHVSLRPLSRTETTALVRLLTRAGSDDTGVTQLSADIWAASEGNPFTAVETIRALHDGAVSVSPDGLPLAERVRHVISARLERLGPHGRRLLAVAAVIGRDFDFAIARQAVELDERDAADGLEELVRRRVLHGVGERFDFVHDRIRAVAYDEVLTPERRRLHTHVADAMVALYTEDLERHYASLGRHYEQGEVWDKAAFYLRRAGKQAMLRAAYHEAKSSFETAHGVLQRLPESHDRREQDVDTLIDLSHALIPLADHGRVLETLLHAERLTQTLADQRRLARIRSALCSAFWMLGAYKKAAECGQHALTLGVALDDNDLQLLTRLRLGQVLYSLGDYRAAAEILPRNGDLSNDNVVHGVVPASLWSALAKLWLAWCLAEVGTFPEAIAQAQDAMALADAVEQPYARVQVHWALGRVLVQYGDTQAAVPLLERGLALCRTIDAPFQFHLNAACLGYAYALSGRAADGVALLSDAVHHITRTEGLFGHSLVLGWLGEAYLVAGRIDDALATATDALDLCRAREERGREASVLRLLGEIVAARDPVDAGRSDEYYRQAIELARQLGMRPVMAHSYLGLGLLHGRMGQHEGARLEIEAAIGEYRAMDSRWWLTRAESALQALTATLE